MKKLYFSNNLLNMITNILEYKGKQEMYTTTTNRRLKQIVSEKN
ncbi:hypothetical protein RV08_GL002196 [Enterococcus mundtii]|nr:hypothetical protein RV08_GL002196 [Enterococcus mundtii]